jgi:hypothetical protein
MKLARVSTPPPCICGISDVLRISTEITHPEELRSARGIWSTFNFDHKAVTLHLAAGMGHIGSTDQCVASRSGGLFVRSIAHIAQLCSSSLQLLIHLERAVFRALLAGSLARLSRKFGLHRSLWVFHDAT